MPGCQPVWRGGGKRVFVYGTSVSSQLSLNRELFIGLHQRGLTAESWPTDKAASLQAFTGNGAWLGWTGCRLASTQRGEYEWETEVS